MKLKTIFLLGTLLSSSTFFVSSVGNLPVMPLAMAQGTEQNLQKASVQVSMVLYQLTTGTDGRQYAIANDGSKVLLPPPGLAPGALQVAVYTNGSGSFWYQAADGSTVAITDPRLTYNAASSPSETPQEKGKRGRRRGALGSFLGAATGAAVGTALTNSYYGVPYGTPIYGNPNSLYYVGPNGSQVYLNMDEEALSSLYNQWTVQQQVVQQNRLNYQQQAQQNRLNYQQQAQQSHLDYQQSRLDSRPQAPAESAATAKGRGRFSRRGESAASVEGGASSRFAGRKARAGGSDLSATSREQASSRKQRSTRGSASGRHFRGN